MEDFQCVLHASQSAVKLIKAVLSGVPVQCHELWVMALFGCPSCYMNAWGGLPCSVCSTENGSYLLKSGFKLKIVWRKGETKLFIDSFIAP